MNVRTAAVAALVALAPLAASAADSASAEARDRPDWNIGAGLQFGDPAVFLPAPTGVASGVTLLSSLSFYGPSVPVATFFLERRLGDRTWLVLGAAGSVTRQSFDAPPASASSFATLTKDDSERASLSVGLRRVVTRPGAVVELSLQGTVEGGYLHEELEYTAGTGARSSIRDTGGYASVTGGIAVERELTGGLGLRISTPLIGASYAKLERHDEAGSRDAERASVFAILAPRLELRLAF